MLHEPFSRRGGAGWKSVLPTLAVLFLGSASAQSPPGGEIVPAYAQAIINGTDSAVVPAGCSSCGGGLPAPYITGPIAGGGCGGDGPCACSDDSCGSCMCKPGRTKPRYCDGCSDSFLGRLGGGFIECLCCPDPCYEGVWNYAANAAFFQDTVRPQTYTRIRWDSGHDLTAPERGEFFWAKPGVLGGRGPQAIENRVNYDELSLYQEIAAGNFAFFVNVPYRGVDPDINPGHSNFGDVDLGTKTMLLDCELIQFDFQFRVYIPAGNPRNGIGTGHTTLEPSFLSSIKLMQDTYLQSQVAYWIPIGGDQDFEGAAWRYGVSLNRQWFKYGPYALISTAEFNGITFTDGAVADRGLNAVMPAPGSNPALYTRPADGDTIITLGGGLRLVICDKFDIGFGADFAVTDKHFADQLYRTEFRVRY
jgi:hypothetical protein